MFDTSDSEEQRELDPRPNENSPAGVEPDEAGADEGVTQTPAPDEQGAATQTDGTPGNEADLARSLENVTLQTSSHASDASEKPGQGDDEELLEGSSRSASEAWPKVEAQLQRAREEGKRLRALEDEAFESLDAYLYSYGDEGQEIAGDWPRLVENRRQSLRAGKRELERLAEVRRAEREEREAREAVVRFQRESEERASELQKKLNEAARRRAQLGGAYQRVDPRPRRRRCPICGLDGVERGRDCPNAANHRHYPRE